MAAGHLNENTPFHLYDQVHCGFTIFHMMPLGGGGIPSVAQNPPPPPSPPGDGQKLHIAVYLKYKAYGIHKARILESTIKPLKVFSSENAGQGESSRRFTQCFETTCGRLSKNSTLFSRMCKTVPLLN